MAANKKRRSKAQRSAAAREAWARKRAEEAMAAVPKLVSPPKLFMASHGLDFDKVAAGPAPVPVTFSATKEGNDLFLGVANNGSLHRVKASPESLRTLALDILRLVG